MKKNAFFKFSIFLSLVFVSADGLTQTANTLANQFAEETGSIAGTAQACGQNISVFNARVVEALNAMTHNNAKDNQQALLIYQSTLSKTQAAQAQTQARNCSEVAQAFLALPIMKPDYKQSVIPELAKMTAPAVAPPSSQPATKPATQPATVPPTQQLVTGEKNAP